MLVMNDKSMNGKSTTWPPILSTPPPTSSIPATACSACARRWPWPTPTATADTILFADAVQGRTIVLAGSQLTVNSDVTIDGGSGVTIDADEKSRVLLVQGDGDGRDARAPDHHRRPNDGRCYDGGGGIRADGYTTLTLDHVDGQRQQHGGR